MRNRFKNLLAIATASLLATVNSASARDPISIEALSSMPKIQSVSMSSDGKNIVALVGKQGAEEYEALYRERRIAALRRNASALGFRLEAQPAK